MLRELLKHPEVGCLRLILNKGKLYPIFCLSFVTNVASLVKVMHFTDPHFAREGECHHCLRSCASGKLLSLTDTTICPETLAPVPSWMMALLGQRRVSEGKMCTQPSTSHLMATNTCICNLTFSCPLPRFFKWLCCCHGQFLSPSLGTDPDLQSGDPSISPSVHVLPSDASTPRVNQPAPPIPLITVLVPDGHVMQAGLITVLLVTSSGNTGKTLESKFVAQEAAGSPSVNSI